LAPALADETTYFWGWRPPRWAALRPGKGSRQLRYSVLIDHSGVIIAPSSWFCGLGYVPGKGAVTRAFQPPWPTRRPSGS